MITSQRRTPHTPKKQFFFCVFSDVPNFSDPHIPVVAREILQRMISQFAAEYTSKTSSPQASRSHSPPHSDQSRPAPLHHLGTPSVSPADSLSGPAQNQNPVLSQLLMAAQDAPLDLTIKKPAAEPHQQDGVLDLSIKKNRNSSSSISLCLHPISFHPIRPSLRADGQVGPFVKTLQNGRRRENVGHSACFKPTSSLAYSLHIKKEPKPESDPESPLSQNHESGHAGLLRNASSSWNCKTNLGALLELKTSDEANKHFKDIPQLLEAAGLLSKSLSTEKGCMKEASRSQGLSLSRSPSFDIKIPQVRVLATGTEASWDALPPECSPVFSEIVGKKLCAILPRQIQKRSSVGSNSSGSEKEFWCFPADRQAFAGNCSVDSETDPGNRLPRKKRGRYRQYNTELLEEAIVVVMGGKMSVSKAQSVYGIPHSTLEYKVKERLGTLKHPPKKKPKLISNVEEEGVSLSPEGLEIQSSDNVLSQKRETKNKKCFYSH
uniref:Ligand-dependent corepressor-like n=1 Tax=Fundulus heteroclitus TaxID=8078 RepID=A0A3Q2NRJ1_FUNHE